MRLIWNIILGAVVAFVVFWVVAIPVYLLSGSTFVGAAPWLIILATFIAWVWSAIEFQHGSPHFRRWLGRGGFTPQPVAQAARMPSSYDPEPKPGAVERIRQAKSLLDDGAITQEEFDTIKQRALRDA